MGEEEEEELDAVGPPPEAEPPSLGPCCACEKLDQTVRNIIMLDLKGPSPGKGWGCVQCGLPPDGASYVVCDDCLEKQIKPKFVILGNPGDGKRISYEQLQGAAAHEHDMTKHPEMVQD